MSNAPNTAAPEQPSIALPIIALASFLVCGPIAPILSIVAFVKNKDKKGTTARTLSIVALCANILFIPAGIGCAAAIAIPNFVQFQCRSKQSEAKMNLRSLAVSQETWRAEHGSYSNDKAAIRFEPMGTNLRYDYAILDAGPESFRAAARGMRDGVDGDTWIVDNKGAPTNVTSACGARE